MPTSSGFGARFHATPELESDELGLNERPHERPALGGPATATQLGD